MSEQPIQRPKSRRPVEYEVGYARPPRANQFKPGQCGNPKGRPKKPKTLQEAVERELDREIIVRENGREKRMSKRDIAARAMVDKSIKGDAAAQRLLFKNASEAATARLGRAADAASEAALAIPVDRTDIAILTNFAAIIRSGGELPYAANETIKLRLDGDESDEFGPFSDTPVSPTSH